MRKPPLDLTLYFSGLILLILGLIYLYTDLTNLNDFVISRFLALGILANTVFLMYRFFILKKHHDHILLELEKLRYIGEEIHTYRQYRHDHKNHMLVINDLAEHSELMAAEDRLEAIRAYTADLLDQDNSTYFDFRTGVVALDLLLFAKLQRAREADMEMTIDIRSTLKAKPKHTLTLVSILSNLLDNAHEATMQVDLVSDRLVQVLISEDTLDYIITVTNTFSTQKPLAVQKLFDSGFSTKKDQGNQGLGLTIVKKLVKRIGGNLQLNVYNEHFFQLSIHLPKHLIH